MYVDWSFALPCVLCARGTSVNDVLLVAVIYSIENHVKKAAGVPLLDSPMLDNIIEQLAACAKK